MPDAVERCFAAGALDVWTVPAQMKKGRPGIRALRARPPGRPGRDRARPARGDERARRPRVARLDRYELEREERVVEVAGGRVRVKVGLLDGRVVNVAPEHDDCAALAKSTGRAVKSIWAEALARAQRAMTTIEELESQDPLARELRRRVLGRGRLVARRRARRRERSASEPWP